MILGDLSLRQIYKWYNITSRMYYVEFNYNSGPVLGVRVKMKTMA